MTPRYRNPVLLSDGRIDMEVMYDSPHSLASAGWMPYTADAHDMDAQSFGRELHRLALQDPRLTHETKSPEEQFAEEAFRVREARNALLRLSDWTQGADVPSRIKDPHFFYRGELRNLPLQGGFPFSVVWPEAPGV